MTCLADSYTSTDELHERICAPYELNRVYRERPALWEQDSVPDGFAWIDVNDVDHNVFSFIRWSKEREPLVCVCNFSPVVGQDYRVGLPRPGRWAEILNTDDAAYGGSDVPAMGVVEAQELDWAGQPASARVTLPPLATVWLTPG